MIRISIKSYYLLYKRTVLLSGILLLMEISYNESAIEMLR